MTLIIDGHNLIPHISGINLSDPDDETHLIKVLQEYCRIKRKKADVFFDQAPPGFSGVKIYGKVKAHFIQQGKTADEAIMDALKKLGKRARNVTVVSSDRQVQGAARAVHAAVISSTEFAHDWDQMTMAEPSLDLRNRQLTEEELADWETLFEQDRLSKGGDNITNKV